MTGPSSRHSRARLILGATLGWVGIGLVADGVPTLLVPYRLNQLGSTDATSLGLVTFVALGAAALIQPVAGQWSDRVGRRPAMATGAVLATVGILGVVLLDSALGFALAAVVAAIGVSVVQAGQQALVPDHVPSDWRGTAGGAKNMFDVGGALLAFVALAALLGSGQVVIAAIVLAVGLIVAIVLGYVLLPGESVSAESVDRSGPWTNLRHSFAVDRGRDAGLVRLIVARFLVLLGIYVVGRFLFTLVATTADSPEQAAEVAGTVLLVLTAATLAASLPAGWMSDRLGRRTLMAIGGLGTAAGVALLPLAGSALAMIGAGLLIAMGSAAFSAASWAALADVVAGAETGRRLGIAHLGTAGAAAIAGAFGIVIDVGGRLAPGGGFVIGFGVASLCAAAGALLAWRTPVATPVVSNLAQQMAVGR